MGDKPVRFSRKAWEDREHWKEMNDRKKLFRINQLIKDTLQNGYGGIGKPEPLKEKKYQGCWSKRIDKEHRFIFRIENGVLYIISCRTHYQK